MQRHGDEVGLTTTEASGGSTPHIVRYVLGISLFLAAAAMTIVWVTGAITAKNNNDNVQTRQQSTENAAVPAEDRSQPVPMTEDAMAYPADQTPAENPE